MHFSQTSALCRHLQLSPCFLDCDPTTSANLQTASGDKWFFKGSTATVACSTYLEETLIFIFNNLFYLIYNQFLTNKQPPSSYVGICFGFTGYSAVIALSLLLIFSPSKIDFKEVTVFLTLAAILIQGFRYTLLRTT